MHTVKYFRVIMHIQAPPDESNKLIMQGNYGGSRESEICGNVEEKTCILVI